MNYEPLNRFAIIKLEEVEKERNGIIINTTDSKKMQEGTIVAISDSNVLENGKEMPIPVKVGDKVLFNRFSGEDFEDKEHKIVEISQIMARQK